MLPIGNRIFNVKKWLLYLSAAISFMPLLVLVMSGEKKNVLILVLGVEVAISFIMFSLLNRITITIDDQGISLQAIFRKRFIAWKDIRETKIILEMGSKSSQNFWYFISTDHKQIRFSTIFFSKKTIQAVAETVIEQSAGALINEKVIAYSQGKFPWYAS